LAADKVGREDLKPYLVGPTALAFGYEDPVLPARLIGQFAQKMGKPEVKIILFQGQLLEREALDRLKNLPSREQLLSQIMGSLNSPMNGLVMVLKGLLRELVGLVDAIAKLKEGEEERPAEKTEKVDESSDLGQEKEGPDGDARPIDQSDGENKKS
jgi:large subunit ribosomal protein L10